MITYWICLPSWNVKSNSQLCKLINLAVCLYYTMFLFLNRGKRSWKRIRYLRILMWKLVFEPWLNRSRYAGQWLKIKIGRERGFCVTKRQAFRDQGTSLQTDVVCQSAVPFQTQPNNYQSWTQIPSSHLFLKPFNSDLKFSLRTMSIKLRL